MASITLIAELKQRVAHRINRLQSFPEQGHLLSGYLLLILGFQVD